jgi:hypothetical protein
VVDPELDQTVGEDIGLIEPIVPVSNEFHMMECVARGLIKLPISPPMISSVLTRASRVRNGCYLWVVGQVKETEIPWPGSS